MSRKWLVISLGVAVILLLLAAGAGWWWVGQYKHPFLMEIAPYRLSESWYIVVLIENSATADFDSADAGA